MRHLILLLTLSLLPVVASAQVGPGPTHHELCGDGRLWSGGTCVSYETYWPGRTWWHFDTAATGLNDGTSRANAFTSLSSLTNAAITRGHGIVIYGGTWREEIRPADSDLVIYAYDGWDTVIDGSKQITETWSAHTATSYPAGIYYLKFPLASVTRPSPASNGDWIGRRSEWLIQDMGSDPDSVLRMVKLPTELTAGHFAVSTTDGTATGVLDTLFVIPAGGGDANTKTWWWGERRYGLYASDEGDASCGQGSANIDSLHVVGLVFRYHYNKRAKGTLCLGRDRNIIEDAKFISNGSGGIILQNSTNSIVRNSYFEKNGTEGVGGTNCDDCTIHNNFIYYNNWEDQHNSGHGGGGKFTKSDRLTVRHNHYKKNQEWQLWLDAVNTYPKIHNNLFEWGRNGDVFLEDSSSYAHVYNNVVYRTRCKDKKASETATQYGNNCKQRGSLNISDSRNSLIHNNTVIGGSAKCIQVQVNYTVSPQNAIFNNVCLESDWYDYNAEQGAGVEVRGIKIAAGDSLSTVSNAVNGNFYGEMAYSFYTQSRKDAAGKYDGNDLATWKAAIGGSSEAMADLSKPNIRSMNTPWGFPLPFNSQFAGKAIAWPDTITLHTRPTTDFFGMPRDLSVEGSDVGAYEINVLMIGAQGRGARGPERRDHPSPASAWPPYARTSAPPPTRAAHAAETRALAARGLSDLHGHLYWRYAITP